MMKIIKSISVLFTLLILNSSLAQDPDVNKFKIGLGFGMGFITENTQTSQLALNAGFEKNSFELTFDGSYFLQSQGDRPRFSKNHQLMMGLNYYILSNNFRPFVGVKGGLAYSESLEYGILNVTTNELEFTPSINPIAAVNAGFEYGVSEKLNVNLEGRLLMGKHLSNSHPTYLDELRFTIGINYTLIN